MNDQDMVFALKMKDEATRVLSRFQQELKQTGGVTKTMADELRRSNAALRDAEQLMERTGREARSARNELRQMAGAFGAFIGGSAILLGVGAAATNSVKAFMEMEGGMSEVRKTSGLTGANLADMKAGIDEMASSVPVAKQQLYELAASAGRAGVTGKTELLEFTKVTAQMQVALDNVDADGVLRVINVLKEGPASIKTFAATLNMLDDTSVTSADRIMRVAEDVATVGAAFKANSGDVLAFSTVLAEANIEGSAGSTALQRMANSIKEAVAVGGPGLKQLADLVGMTTAEFAAMSKNDMSLTITKLVGGLRQLELQGNELGKMGAMKALGVDAEEAQKPVTALITNYDNLLKKRAQVRDTSASLMKFDEENAIQLEKFSAQLQLLKNNFGTLQAAIGADFVDALRPLVEALSSMVISLTEWYNSLSEAGQKIVAFSTVGVASLIGLLVQIGFLRAGLAAFGVTVTSMGPLIARAFFMGLAALGPVGLAIAGVSAAAAGMYMIFGDTEEAVTDLTKSASDNGASMQEMRDKAAKAVDMQMALEKNARLAANSLNMGTTEADKHAAALMAMANNAQFAASQLAKLNLAQAGQEFTQASQQFREVTDERKDIKKRIERGGGVIGSVAGKELAEEDLAANNPKTIAAARRLREARATRDLAVENMRNVNMPTGEAPKTEGAGEAGAYSEIPKTENGKKTAGKQDQRANALRDMSIENQMYREQIALLNQIESGAFAAVAAKGQEVAGSTEVLIQQEQAKAIIEATANLRQQTGDKNAKLNEDEIQALRDKVELEAKMNAISNRAEDTRLHGITLKEIEEEIAIIGLDIKERERRLAVIRATSDALRADPKNPITPKAANEAETRADAEGRLRDAQNADSALRNDRNATNEAREMARLVGVDTAARRANVAEVKAKYAAIAQGRTVSAEEVAQARELALANYEGEEALRKFNDAQAERMAYFDAAADAITGFATGAMSAQDAVKGLIKSLINLIIQYQILAPIKRAFENSGGSGGGGDIISMAMKLFAFQNGGVFQGGSVVPFANGGVVNGPTNFPMRGGKMGLMGEAGAEAIMPLARGSDGKLGVRGGGGGGVNFAPQISVSVQAPDDTKDPAEFGRIVGRAVDARMAKFAEKESRPGGAFYRG